VVTVRQPLSLLSAAHCRDRGDGAAGATLNELVVEDL